jgi:hypothetical protein
MHGQYEVRASLGMLLLAAAASATVAACGGGSDSEVGGGGKSTGGTNAAQAGSNASSGSGTGGSSGSTGKNDAGGPATPEGGGPGGDPGEACEARESWTEALHYTLEVTWPATTAGESGTGTINIWSRLSLTADGNALELGLHACGSVLPETNLTIAGRLATGGEKVLIEVPEAVWDAPSIPITMASGEHAGFEVGSSFEFSYVSLLGVTMADPMGAWPASGAGMDVFDLEEDGADGYTAVPRSGGGYVLPPTAVGLGGSAPSADQVHLISRQAMTLTGTRTSCDEHSGTAEVSAFDNHVVGCHIEGGSACNADQTSFVDENRMRYMVTSATYEAKAIADDASCADVRAALPAK